MTRGILTLVLSLKGEEGFYEVVFTHSLALSLIGRGKLGKAASR